MIYPCISLITIVFHIHKYSQTISSPLPPHFATPGAGVPAAHGFAAKDQQPHRPGASRHGQPWRLDDLGGIPISDVRKAPCSRMENMEKLHVIWKTGGFLDHTYYYMYIEVSINGATPRSSNFLGVSPINHPFWGTPIYGNFHVVRRRHFCRRKWRISWSWNIENPAIIFLYIPLRSTMYPS